MGAGLALLRGNAPGIGNFGPGAIRATLWILLPELVVLAILLTPLGGPQTFAGLGD